MKFKIFLLSLALTLLPGCSLLEKVSGSDTLTKIQLGVDFVYLDREFENVRDTLMLVDFEEDQRRSVDVALANLQKLKDELDTLLNGSSVERAKILGTVDGARTLNTLATNFNSIKNTYAAHIIDGGGTIDPDIVRYGDSAVRVYDVLAKHYEKTGTVDVSALRELLGYALKGYLDYKTLGASGAVLKRIAPPSGV